MSRVQAEAYRDGALQHVFVSNVDADDLAGAFESISTQVKVKVKVKGLVSIT